MSKIIPFTPRGVTRLHTPGPWFHDRLDPKGVVDRYGIAIAYAAEAQNASAIVQLPAILKALTDLAAASKALLETHQCGPECPERQAVDRALTRAGGAVLPLV